MLKILCGKEPSMISPSDAIYREKLRTDSMEQQKIVFPTKEIQI